LFIVDVVYAVEASEMASAAELVIAKNGFSDIIQVFHCKVEDVVLPVNKVDVIVSEWMGVFLLFVSKMSIFFSSSYRYIFREWYKFLTYKKRKEC
jgi:protein arginine N-methyltransferase 1